MFERDESLKSNEAVITKYAITAKLMLGKAGKFAQEICSYYKDYYHPTSWDYLQSEQAVYKLYDAYAELCNIRPEKVLTFGEFWNSKFDKVIIKFFGKEDARLLREISKLSIHSPYAHDIYRPSYRSSRVCDYVGSIFRTFIDCMFFNKYETALADIMRRNEYVSSLYCAGRIAVALREGDEEVSELVSEAIMGDNSGVRLLYPVIAGVIKSGMPEHIEKLGKLMLAAKGQEGVRQSILEHADCGAAEAHAYFIKLMLDHNLARFSSAIRAFGTWTGLALDNEKPAVIKKCLELAHKHLSDPSLCQDGLASADALEVYMALWASTCRDIHVGVEHAKQLLLTPEKYRRLVGWYYISSTAHAQTKHQTAMDFIDVRDSEELAWICLCLYQDSLANTGRWHYYDEKRDEHAAFPDSVFPESADDREEQFAKLCGVLKFIGNKKTKFEESVFPWASVQLDSQSVAKCMVGLAAYDRSENLIIEFAKYLPQVSADIRYSFYLSLLDPRTPKQWNLLLEGLFDKSVDIKREVVNKLGKSELKPADIGYLTDALTTTSSALRKAIMTLLEKQPEALIIPAISELLASSKDKQVLAGAELLDVFSQENPELTLKFEEMLTKLHNRAKLSKDLEVILARISKDEENDEFTAENGFGLFNPASADFDKTMWAAKRSNVKIYNRDELKSLLSVDEKELCSVILPIRDVLVKNSGMECEVEDYDGRKTKVLIGDNPYHLPKLPGWRQNQPDDSGIHSYYLADEILEALDAANVSPTTIAKIINFGGHEVWEFDEKLSSEAKKIFQGLPITGALNFDKYVRSHSAIISNILESVILTRKEGLFDFAISVWVSLFELIPEASMMNQPTDTKENAYYNSNYAIKRYMPDIKIITNWLYTAEGARESDEQRIKFLKESWYAYLCTNRKRRLDGCVFCAKQFGLVSDDALYHELLAGLGAAGWVRELTSGASWAKAGQKKRLEEHPFLPEYIDKATERIVTVEEKRGELPTPLSAIASQVGYFKGGIRHFTALLTALGKDNFFRGYMWGTADSGKQATLSLLLKNCYPHPDDTAEIFESAVKAAGITENRLLQAVMYAPQWADFAEKALGINGLTSAVWLFHAHINESFSAEKETKVSRYSPVTPQQFSDGTFDKDWFLDAYSRVGEKVFGELYKNAKYITSSSSTHRRSQLYADAVLSRLDRGAIEAEIADKRNQEKLRAYALIPLDDKDPGDALFRYEFIQKFAKQSKQFGAQRKASEGKAVLIALQNLALTTGFGDVDRMTWYLESEKMDRLRPLMDPQDFDGTAVSLEFAEDGTPSLRVSKDGKILKSLPKALSKKEEVLKLQAAVKDLRDQKTRAKLSLEMAMVSRSVMSTGEIARLLEHPVLKGMLSTVVFSANSILGFPLLKGGEVYLAQPGGNLHLMQESSWLKIAHPYDFIQNACWSSYQQHIYTNKIIQPFKQIFREYYPVTQDELDAVNVSMRYSGHQVQPKRTVALLKSRGWTVDYESGLQRVYHKENIVAVIYALADWFSPADIEAPTLEALRFYSRENGEALAFSDIPPVIFSEVMRDIDLVVSVAHVGGVDPEASHSTVEMRIAVARELLSLLSVNNVSFQTAHAQVKGSMGDYSIHMGSGTVHKSGSGMLVVLPVHSQARGRIFLPFADDDPKTAEIMSKILLFADDAKIKDPAILSQTGR
ncbi:MAG: DUF4132 domain-containing protein [Oscillospiraceae bacterium]|nr:DUF4132 domain-containing protein [Oscillospiraceae bacterium]